MNYFRPHLEKYPLPKGWNQLPLKQFIVGMTSGSRPSGGSESDATGVFSLGGEHIDDHGGLRFDNMTYVPRSFFEAIRENAVVESNDTLLNKDGANTGKVAFVDETFPFAEACINEHVFRIRADRSKVADRNLFYFLLSGLGQAQLSKYIQGSAQPGINQRFPKFLLMRVPTDFDEQTRIAETMKAADEHIRSIEEQIRKAERVKTALLQSLFVAGLPGSDFPTNESKIGPVPSHWEFRRLGKTFREPPFNGVSPESRPNPPGTPILNVSCVNDGICSVDAVTYVDVDEATIRANSAEKGDFFVLRGNGNRDYVGTGGWLRVDPPENCIFSDKLIRLRFDNSRVGEGFYPYLWESRSFQIRLQSKAQSSSGLWMMNKRDIAREWVALPPKDQQTQMVEILDSASETLAALQSQLTASRRVKQSLLQNLLTGKIRLKA